MLFRSQISKQKGNTIHYGKISFDGQIIDEALVSIFRAPHSYTGEDSIEISCHGSVYIQQKILQEIITRYNARLAKPGEFTTRAFLSGKMDLSQAEAVADLIASTSATSHRVAMQQMRGGYSEEIRQLRSKMLEFISLIELELDFSEEDVEFADRNALKDLIIYIRGKLKKLAASFEYGNAIKNGIPIAIAGEPNVGKSTLLNLLLKEEKAIVSDIPGTTRDAIEDLLVIGGYTFRLIDTAGIRETHDHIESLGIGRTFDKLRQATVILLLIDANTQIDEANKMIAGLKEKIGNGHKKLIVLINKIDTAQNNQLQNLKSARFDALGENDRVIAISARHHKNIEALTDELVATAEIFNIDENDVVVTNARHFEALTKAGRSIDQVMESLEQGISGDLLAIDLREAIHHLGEITGEITTDEVLGNIFRNFCIGK